MFVNSVSDLFHKDVPDAFLDQCFAIMAFCSRHTFQILTKRPHRMKMYVDGLADRGGSGRGFRRLVNAGAELGLGLEFEGIPLIQWPIPNIWLGTSVEHQAAADKRIPLLLQTDAAVRFLSCEPLLDRVYLTDYLPSGKLHWVIVGGESGQKRRDMELEWLQEIVSECLQYGVAPFVKQDSASKSEQRGRIPDSLWIREFPNTGRSLSDFRASVPPRAVSESGSPE